MARAYPGRARKSIQSGVRIGAAEAVFVDMVTSLPTTASDTDHRTPVNNNRLDAPGHP